VQVCWNVVMLSLAGVTLLAASRTVDQIAVEWSHVVLDAFIIGCVAASAGIVSKLTFRCAGARRWAVAVAWLLNVAVVAGCSGAFAWYADGFYDEKGVRALAGWGFACSFTWLLIEPLWVLLVVLLVQWIVQPTVAGSDKPAKPAGLKEETEKIGDGGGTPGAKDDPSSKYMVKDEPTTPAPQVEELLVKPA